MDAFLGFFIQNHAVIEDQLIETRVHGFLEVAGVDDHVYFRELIGFHLNGFHGQRGEETDAGDQGDHHLVLTRRHVGGFE